MADGKLPPSEKGTTEFETGLSQAPFVVAQSPTPTQQAPVDRDEQMAEKVELHAAMETLRLSSKVADDFTFYGLTARGKIERAPIDNKFWFSKIYAVITHEEILHKHLRRYPSFMLHFVPIFYDLYYQALQARLNNQVVAKHWDDHFKITEIQQATSLRSYLEQIRESIISGVKAHILGDMAIALEKSYWSYRIKYPEVNLQFDAMEPDYFDVDPKVFEYVSPRMFTYLSNLTLPFPSIEAGQFLFGVGNQLVEGLPISAIVYWRRIAWEQARVLLNLPLVSFINKP